MKTKWKAMMITLILSAGTLAATATAAVVTQVKKEAGTGDLGFQDGLAEQALFSTPYGLTLDKDGSLIIADSYNNRIRRLKDGEVTTIAGASNQNDAYGFPEGGFQDTGVEKALFHHPRGVAVDSQGNLFVSDSGNNAIRIITKNQVYTLAGRAEAGYQDGKGTEAKFHLPSGMAIDAKDNLYVADTLNHVIRQVSPEGIVSTLAGRNSKEGGYQDGKAEEALFNEPSDIAIDKEGGVYVLDSGNQLVRKIKDGKVSTVAGIYSEQIPGTAYHAGGFQNGDETEARFNFPMGIEIAEDGSIFIADTWNHRIRVIDTDGNVGTLAGTGSSGLVNSFADQAQFNAPVDVLYHNGTLYISDMHNNCIRSLNVEAGSTSEIVDRSDIAKSIKFAKATDEMQVWFNGSRVEFSNALPYKEGNQIYVPARMIFETWGAKVTWNKQTGELDVSKTGFHKTYIPGKDTTFFKSKRAYIDTRTLAEATKLRIEWFPEYNALVIQDRNQ